MESNRDELATAIGSRVRARRLARGWTLDEMAERSGVSRRMVVKVEKGETNPSVTTLLLLSDALGIGLPALVADPDESALAMTRRGGGATLWTSPDGGSGVLLAGTPAPDVLELWRWTLAPDDVHTSDAHTSGTKEILHVVDGTVTLGLTADRVELGAGDTFAFDGDQPHSYGNGGTRSATFTLAVFEPGVGTTVKESADG